MNDVNQGILRRSTIIIASDTNANNVTAHATSAMPRGSIRSTACTTCDVCRTASVRPAQYGSTSAASASTHPTAQRTGCDWLRSMSASETSDSGIVASGCFETTFASISWPLCGCVGVGRGSASSSATSRSSASAIGDLRSRPRPRRAQFLPICQFQHTNRALPYAPAALCVGVRVARPHSLRYRTTQPPLFPTRDLHFSASHVATAPLSVARPHSLRHRTSQPHSPYTHPVYDSAS